MSNCSMSNCPLCDSSDYLPILKKCWSCGGSFSMRTDGKVAGSGGDRNKFIHRMKSRSSRIRTMMSK